MWREDSIVPVDLKFNIVGHGSLRETVQEDPLIIRALNVACFLTRRVFAGEAQDFIELVSTDPEKKEVTFRLKK